MCGILWAKRREGNPVAKIIAKRYKHQAHRGSRGFGYIAVKNGHVTGVMRSEDEKAILASLKDETANEILFHHRLPTSTPNLEEATHPIIVEHNCFKYNYYVIHNGVIKNHDELKKEHERFGIIYNTEYTEKTQERVTRKFNGGEEVVIESNSKETTKYNDSEALANDIAMYLEGYQDEIKAVGNIAIILYQTDKNGKILATYHGHNKGNPLVSEYVLPRENKRKKGKKGKKKNQKNIATGNIAILKSEGNGVDVAEDKLYKIEYPSGKIEEIDVKIGKVYDYPRNVYTGNEEKEVNKIFGYNNGEINEFPSLPPRSSSENGGRTSFNNENRNGHLDEDWDWSEKMEEIESELERQFNKHSEIEIDKRLDDIQEKIIAIDADKDSWEESITTSTDIQDIGEYEREIKNLDEERDELLEEWQQLQDDKYELSGGIKSFMSDEIEV